MNVTQAFPCFSPYFCHVSYFGVQSSGALALPPIGGLLLAYDTFEMNDELKNELTQKHFKEIMHILGLNLSDDSLSGSPHRVAKIYVEEIFSGLNPKNKPKTKLLKNKYKYSEMLFERDLTLYSYCENHFVPIVGNAYLAYISNEQVVGLSKINRLVQYCANRPQAQERLTNQITVGLK